MKMGLKALLPVSAFGLCLAITGCNTEEAPETNTPPPAPSAVAPGEAPGELGAPPVVAPEETPGEAAPAVEPKVEAPAEEPATP